MYKTLIFIIGLLLVGSANATILNRIGPVAPVNLVPDPVNPGSTIPDPNDPIEAQQRGSTVNGYNFLISANNDGFFYAIDNDVSPAVIDVFELTSDNAFEFRRTSAGSNSFFFPATVGGAVPFNAFETASAVAISPTGEIIAVANTDNSQVYLYSRTEESEPLRAMIVDGNSTNHAISGTASTNFKSIDIVFLGTGSVRMFLAGDDGSGSTGAVQVIDVDFDLVANTATTTVIPFDDRSDSILGNDPDRAIDYNSNAFSPVAVKAVSADLFFVVSDDPVDDSLDALFAYSVGTGNDARFLENTSMARNDSQNVTTNSSGADVLYISNPTDVETFLVSDREAYVYVSSATDNRVSALRWSVSASGNTTRGALTGIDVYQDDTGDIDRLAGASDLELSRTSGGAAILYAAATSENFIAAFSIEDNGELQYSLTGGEQHEEPTLIKGSSPLLRLIAASDPSGDPMNRAASSEITVFSRESNLDITVETSTFDPQPGQRLNYRVVIENTGDSDVPPGMVVTINAGGLVIFGVSASIVGDTSSGVTCQVGSLPSIYECDLGASILPVSTDDMPNRFEANVSVVTSSITTARLTASVAMDNTSPDPIAADSGALRVGSFDSGTLSLSAIASPILAFLWLFRRRKQHTI